MSTPEPLDEYPDAPAETRGGDRFADITAVDVSLYPVTRTVASGACRGCGCGEEPE